MWAIFDQLSPLGWQLSFKSSQSLTLIRRIEVGSAGKDNILGHIQKLRLSRQERSLKLGRDWIPQFMKHRCWMELKLSDLSNKMNGSLQLSSVSCPGIAKPSVDSMSLSIMELLTVSDFFTRQCEIYLVESFGTSTNLNS
jgi:hypothetical protein